ncbi:heterokaryon incompatibility protein (HET) domain-containing protein [Apiospora kogelbergensis]|uniref:Heterokaryon incompatibility protein (HET) domain-containing protein n=1 Tax=Apiospora kogelbergensis TaxID=1337665 RepID=A0AAW0R229_9PEZI
MPTTRDDGSIAYDALAKGTIRLLNIQDAQATDYIGVLETWHLDEAPSYYALSYCWGSQVRDVALRAEQGTIYVNQDLFEGTQRLKRLASNDSELQPPLSYVWIDTICINQADTAERSSQVSLMGRIYSQAINVLIWLGPTAGDFSAAWSLVDSIYGVFRAENPSAKTLIDIPLTFYSPRRHELLGLPDWDDKGWESLRMLFTLPWFTRIWVIQEVAISSQDPIILLGQYSYPWSRLGWVASWMRRCGYFRLEAVPQVMRNVDEISNIRRSQVPWPLDALVTTTSVKFHATDQRDKVYALLGLAAECSDGSNVPTPLIPDYTLAVEEVYVQIARYLVLHKASLAMLIRTRDLSEDIDRSMRKYNLKGLPTWTPNWSDFAVSDREIPKSFSWITYSGLAEPPMLGFPRQYGASNRLPLKALESRSHNTLRLTGLIVDSVRTILRLRQTEHSAEFGITDFASLSKRMLEVAIPLFDGKDVMSFAACYIQTTTADQHYLSGRGSDQMLKDGSAYLLSLLSDHGTTRSLFETCFDGPDGFKQLREISLGGDAVFYEELARNYCHGRSLIVTSRCLIGIGPDATCPTDLLAVLYGGGVPYFIRLCENGYQFVGGSYFRDFMNGEAVAALQQGVLQEDIIELC